MPMQNSRPSSATDSCVSTDTAMSRSRSSLASYTSSPTMSTGVSSAKRPWPMWYRIWFLYSSDSSMSSSTSDTSSAAEKLVPASSAAKLSSSMRIMPHVTWFATCAASSCPRPWL